ncbi:EFR1 family ferrodoxin [Propionispora hippei]|uniref:4Fe-4S dicluster domain-containing protein n=1 Tax=Propionispora hippei DSM 15287 TaxID=1123003 RepID=A0A1M6F231_9FIRM|nr:EFR1 family ferrodoxin [Propionispora hippei]SHI91743.1 hypothetical protein SAMN02745170_01339 [Propionispora hippei DSM 15287]
MPKTIIYYFSATGNSKHVANVLASNIEDCRLCPIPHTAQEESIYIDADMVGLVIPTHYFGVPPLVAAFIRKLKFAPSVNYVFAIITSGSSQYLNSSLKQLKKLFFVQGQELHAGYHVQMISSYIPLSDIPAPEKLQQTLAAADKKIERMIHSILIRKYHYDSEGMYTPLQGINRYWQKHLLPSTYTKFSCRESCTGCATCAKVCPVKNITMAGQRPQWRKDCQECLACLHLCPSESIEFGKRTAARQRYRHPQVTVKELLIDRLP